MPAKPQTRRSAAPRRARSWVRLADEELLKVRLCDLDLSVADSRLARPMQRLYAELAGRGIEFKPHAWLAEEWFSPDGVPGIAVPFFLAHPRLERLERRMMHTVEGGNTRWLMRILRHEAGHALDNAYRLRRRASWRETFGPASLPYPERYRARPGSRRYVHHLGAWYAQAHPTEDFAETFAVWLKPNSAWRREYRGWRAYAKLEYIDQLAAEIGEVKAPVIDRTRIEDVAEESSTLRQHYERKLSRYQMPRRSGADELLLKVFTTAPKRRSAPKAA